MHLLFYAAALYAAVLEKWTYPGFEGDQFKDHLHSEESSEEHVEDVHGSIKVFRLLIVLQRHISKMLLTTRKVRSVGVLL